MEEKNTMNFEEAMKGLEQIAGELEKGNLNLDESVAKFEEGMKLSKICNDILEENFYFNKKWRRSFGGGI